MLSALQIASQGFTPVVSRLVALQGFGDAGTTPAPRPPSVNMSVGRPTAGHAARKPGKDPRIERQNQIILALAMAVVSGKTLR